MEATECPKKNPADQDIKQQPINAPRWDDTPPVRLTGWVFEVPQVAAKEERSVLWYASDGLSGEMGCLGKPDDYADGSCCVMQWMLPPPKTTCSD